MPRGNLARLLCRVLVDVAQIGLRQIFPRVQKAFALRERQAELQVAQRHDPGPPGAIVDSTSQGVSAVW